MNELIACRRILLRGELYCHCIFISCVFTLLSLLVIIFVFFAVLDLDYCLSLFQKVDFCRCISFLLAYHITIIVIIISLLLVYQIIIIGVSYHYYRHIISLSLAYQIIIIVISYHYYCHIISLLSSYHITIIVISHHQYCHINHIISIVIPYHHYHCNHVIISVSSTRYRK